MNQFCRTFPSVEALIGQRFPWFREQRYYMLHSYLLFTNPCSRSLTSSSFFPFWVGDCRSIMKWFRFVFLSEVGDHAYIVPVSSFQYSHIASKGWLRDLALWDFFLEAGPVRVHHWPFHGFLYCTLTWEESGTWLCWAIDYICSPWVPDCLDLSLLMLKLDR